MIQRKLGWVLGIALCAGIAPRLAAPADGAPIIDVRASSIPHAALFGLAFDKGQGVAVGAGGAVLESRDGGATWETVAQEETDLALLSVARRGSHTVAVGQMGVVLVRTPEAWERVDSGVDARLLTVDVNSAGVAVAAGQFGTVLRSTDGGRNWAPAAPHWASMESEEHFGTGEPTIYGAVVDESGQVTIAGEFGVIMRSSDAGRTWRIVRRVDPHAPTLHALHIAPAGQGNSYAVGQSGELLVSADGGETWKRRGSPTEHNFLGVAASPNGQVVVTGMRTMLRSTDAGRNWQAVKEGDTTTDWYQAVRTEHRSGRILAVGHSGRIIRIGG